MNKKFLLVFVFLFLFSFAFVSSQETMGGTYSKQGAEYMDSGVIINTLVYDSVPFGEDFTLYMIPYELTGKTLDSSDVDCRIGITSPDGSRFYLLDSNDNFTIVGEDDIWTAVIPSTFLNESGSYLLNWDCHDGVRGGYFNSHIEVLSDSSPVFNPFHMDFTSPISIIIFLLILALAVFLFVKRVFLISGALLLFSGIMLLFNGLNFFISLIFFVFGIIVIFFKS